MKITVDKTKCIGCGACASIEPTVFQISAEDGKSQADSNACTLNHREEGCKQAASVCPVGAITIEE